MPKSNRPGRKGQPASLGPRELGLRAFHAGRLNEAIAAWQRIAAGDPAVTRALAEAHFRRALSRADADPTADLRRAAELAPSDPRFTFHLGRVHHRAGDAVSAESYYRATLAREPGNQAAARLLALLTLERDDSAVLDTLPGMTPELRARVAPAQAIMRGKQPPADDSALGAFWRGLGQLAAGGRGARTALGDERPLPAQALHTLRRYYRAAAAAQAGDTAAALKGWQQLYQEGARPPLLEANLAALLHERLAALVAAGELAAAGDLALQWAELAGSPAFDELRLQALDRAAHTSAASGEWAAAADYWDAARQILAGAQGLGSPRPILHNLALAYERIEMWEEAADAWRALLRTRARKGGDQQDAQRWAWVRARIIECYRHAGRPDEAVAVFRQALKADPSDLDLRIQLADALYANDQERAAHNEILRILELDPDHPEALLRKATHLTERWQFDEAEQIARRIAERHPERADLRRSVAEIFLHHGREHSQYGHYEAAYQAFVEGERYAPDNPRFPLNQARMLGLMRRPVDTAALIERALSVGGESTETWSLAIETWAMADKLKEAMALIERFERERDPGAQDYVAVGMQLMTRALPPPPPMLFGGLGPPPKPVNTPWTALALELLEKAVDLSPDDKRIPMSIASMLMLPRPDLARPFAERAVQHDPDDPEALILLGLVLGLGDKSAEAKSTLQRASKLARSRGRPDLHEQAQEIRRVVGTPMLRMMLSAGLSGELDELDELEDFFG